MAKVNGLEVVDMSETDLEASKEMCVHLERMLTTHKQYGELHPEYKRKVETLFEFTQEALVYSDVGSHLEPEPLLLPRR